jgi:hypothetical protein
VLALGTMVGACVASNTSVLRLTLPPVADDLESPDLAEEFESPVRADELEADEELAFDLEVELDAAFASELDEVFASILLLFELLFLF